MHWGAVARRRLGKEIGVLDAGRIDADLVGAGIEKRADIVDGIDAAAHGQRNEHLGGDRLDHVIEESAVFDAGADIEERKLVGPLLVIAARDLDRVAGIAQVDEIDALDHAAVRDVEAGDDAFGEAHFRCRKSVVRDQRRRHRRRRDIESRSLAAVRGYDTAPWECRQLPLPAFSASLKLSVPS
jgi:hypothetical protein